MSDHSSLAKISSMTSEMHGTEIRPLKATSHSTIFDISMRPVREDQRHRQRFAR